MKNSKKETSENIIQTDRKRVKQFFSQKTKGKSKIYNTPWITTAVGTELQQLYKEEIIKNGMKVLEIGCSIGVECCFLSKHGMDVTGVDFIPETIETAKEYTKIVDADVEYICDDFLEMPVEKMEKKFDFIFDQGCFHHFPYNDREKYAKKISKLLKKEGLFFLRAFSNRMIPSPTNDGPLRISSDDIYDTFHRYFITEHLYLFNNLPLPNPSSYKPQIFWSYLGRRR